MAELEVFVVTPARQMWSGRASMVIARGTEGEVGVMAGHAPMLIRLGIGPLRIFGEGNREIERAVIDGGFMHVTPGPDVTRVDVLADGGELVGEVDYEAAERRRVEAERRLEQRDDAEAQAELAKATARVNLRT